MQYTVQGRNKGGVWYSVGAHTSEYVAIKEAEDHKEMDEKKNFRVIDENGNVRMVI